MDENCDHLMGIIACVGEDEYLLASTRDAAGQAALNACSRWLAQGLGHPDSVKRVMALDTPEKALADKTDFFAYCPRCGERLIA